MANDQAQDVCFLRTERNGMMGLLDRNGVKERLGVWPEQVVDLLGLWGDFGEEWGENFTRDLFEKLQPQRRKEGLTAATALAVAGESGDRVFTLTGSENAYRVFVEAMSEGADKESKTEEATGRKLEKAAEQGDSVKTYDGKNAWAFLPAYPAVVGEPRFGA